MTHRSTSGSVILNKLVLWCAIVLRLVPSVIPRASFLGLVITCIPRYHVSAVQVAPERIYMHVSTSFAIPLDVKGLAHSFDIVPRLAKYCENMFPLPAFNVQYSVLIGGSPLLSWTTPIRLVLVSLHIPTNIAVRPTSYRSDESYAGQFAPAHFFPRVCSHSMG